MRVRRKLLAPFANDDAVRPGIERQRAVRKVAIAMRPTANKNKLNVRRRIPRRPIGSGEALPPPR